MVNGNPKPDVRPIFTTVCEAFDGGITLLHEGKTLAYKRLQQGQKPIPIKDEKTLCAHIDQVKQKQQKKTWKPAIDHPWKRPAATG